MRKDPLLFIHKTVVYNLTNITVKKRTDHPKSENVKVETEIKKEVNRVTEN